MRRVSLLFFLLASVFSLSAQNTAFDSLMSQAQKFAHDFPREKVHLHFDNSSYYQGDTIWYKAYVVNAADNKPSLISRPLYVELVDQLGNVVKRQIVKLDNGEGKGQISLSGLYFTGYFEVRAYTKWMLAFSQPQYFSRTFPIYRKRIRPNEPRSIATYSMDNSMKQRPKEKVSKLSVNFYPEGGHLVQGVATHVGMETISSDSGRVNITGNLVMEDGQGYPVSTIHDGMGSFYYVPGDKPATVQFTFAGKKYKFELPEAEKQGYVLNALTYGDNINVLVSCAGTPTDSLAVFVFEDGVPLTYAPVHFSGSTARLIRIVRSSIPAGVIRLALVNTSGQTIADRFCYNMPSSQATLAANTNQMVYEPYKKITCRLKLSDEQGFPIKNASVSVSVTDATGSDYLPYDNNIYTDLLLTSDLKGYIPNPGFYFIDRSNLRMKMLDNLLLIRGWRKYDLNKVFGREKFVPAYLPESRLMLYGHVDAYFRGVQKGLGVTVMARNDSLNLAGTVTTDSLGNFVLPLDDFSGSMDAIIQTRKEGKSRNRESVITFKRNFEAPLRAYDYNETHPQWAALVDTTAVRRKIEADDSLANDSVHQLAGVTVKAKYRNKSLNQRTESFERHIVGYYNIRQIVDRMRDEGEPVGDFASLLHTINPDISMDGKYYKTNELTYSVFGKMMKLDFLDGYINAIETAILYRDLTGLQSYAFDSKNYRVKEDEATDYFTNLLEDTISQTKLNKMYVRCDLTMNDHWDANKSYVDSRGIRTTLIQGYEQPVAFYSPTYSDNVDIEAIGDKRRTLYWNPDMKTDDKGEIVINCYNASGHTAVGISAETVANGHPAAILMSSCPTRK